MKIAYISTYPPRKCGLATFNHNLIKAVAANLSSGELEDHAVVIALNDSEDDENYDYPSEVKFVIRQQRREDYDAAAAFINSGDIDACVVQHEFGIYGGACGLLLLPFLNQIDKPIVSILHTVLACPTFLQRTIIKEVVKQSSKVVVMGKKAIGFLEDIYEVPPEKIQWIEHGVPDLEPPVVNPVYQLCEFKDKKILLTFGLISRNKGLETVVKALPAIVAQHSDVVYVVLGNTHPGVLKSSGEEYRDYLKSLAQELNVGDHLLFMNRFVQEEELINYLSAAAVYITPYFNEAQITSGTLAYAIGAGAAVVSTPYWHAQELLDENRGRLFDFKDEKGLASRVCELLDFPEKLQTLKANAYRYGLKLRWPKIGKAYLEAIQRAVTHPDYSHKILQQLIDPGRMPKLDLSYIKRITDDTGIFQHAMFGIPNRKEGYCVDDNSRAIILMLMAYKQTGDPNSLAPLPIYLSFTHHMQLADGNFRNFMSFSRQYLDEQGTDDSFGRTIWALGFLIHTAPSPSYVEFGREIFFKAIPHCARLVHLRGMCNAVTGLSYYLKSHPYDELVLDTLKDLTGKLVEAYQRTRSQNWHWFEDKMTYDNAIFPMALLHAAEITGEAELREIALESLRYLENLTLTLNSCAPIGNDGWHSRGNKIVPLYDQQAIEIMAMVLMYQQAFVLTKEPAHLKKMFSCYLWFLGENSLRIPLYDEQTKGCADGLHRNGVNRNQGAESTLAYLISHLAVLHGLAQDRELAAVSLSDLATIENPAA